MQKIKVERNLSQQRIAELNLFKWPTWSKDVSEFPWHYDERETCYIVEGEVEVTPVAGPTALLKKGDLAVFPAGMSCTWKVTLPLKKHYQFG